MDQIQFEELIKNLVSLPNETETVEFKENKFNKDDIGERMSALSNSANLHDKKMPFWFLVSKTIRIILLELIFHQAMKKSETINWNSGCLK